jgi:hypothetical protein
MLVSFLKSAVEGFLMKELRQRLQQNIASYPNLACLFKGKIPKSPRMSRPAYSDKNIEDAWRDEFSFWNVLLNETDPQFKSMLQKLDGLVTKCESAYGRKKLRDGITSNLFDFLSELEVYETFLSHGVKPRIEPTPSSRSIRKMDLSVVLEKRVILIEVITPRVPGEMIKEVGFRALDLGLSKKVAGDIVHHLSGVSKPTGPVIVIVNGVYSGLGPMNLEPAIEELNRFSSGIGLLVSALLLYRSNWGASMAVKPSGPSLTESEISKLKKIFG